MKILHVHNYHMGRGGMEIIYEYTTRLLRDRGHEVIELSRDSATLTTPVAKLRALGSGIYSPSAYKEARQLIEAHRPDLAYVHNLYPMLSTSVFDACRAADIPIVMNIGDYKLTCPMGQHLRGGAICTKCLDGSVLWSAVHACKGGRLTSAAYAVTHGITRLRQIYQRDVDLFVTLSQFTADHLARAGFSRSRITVIPSLCDLPADIPAQDEGQYAAYVGRLSPEKGLNVLMEAARLSGIPTRVAGTGTLAGLAETAPPCVRFVGPASRESLPDFYRGARFLVLPSVWYEVFGIVMVEAMTLGIPVIASNIGGIPEVFEHERSGLLAPPGDARALADAMRRLWNDPMECRRMGQAAREYALREYSPGMFYRRLMAAFDRAVESHRARVHAPAGAVSQSEAVP